VRICQLAGESFLEERRTLPGGSPAIYVHFKLALLLSLVAGDACFGTSGEGKTTTKFNPGTWQHGKGIQWTPARKGLAGPNTLDRESYLRMVWD